MPRRYKTRDDSAAVYACRVMGECEFEWCLPGNPGEGRFSIDTSLTCLRKPKRNRPSPTTGLPLRLSHGIPGGLVIYTGFLNQQVVAAQVAVPVGFLLRAVAGLLDRFLPKRFSRGWISSTPLGIGKPFLAILHVSIISFSSHHFG